MFDFEIENIGERFGIDPDLIRAVIMVESNFRPNIKTPETKKGKLIGFSYGLMQILDSTARALGVRDLNNLFNPYFNIFTGVRYLKGQFNKYGNKDFAVAAYNAGRPLIRVATGEFVNQAYVNKVNKWLKIFRRKTLINLGAMAAAGYLAYRFFIKPRPAEFKEG